MAYALGLGARYDLELSMYAISFWIPTAVLATALAIKLPTIIRLWKDPLLRAVGGLLLLACAVFVFVTPSTIVWTNRVTGVPNISAPLVYSLLTAFCGSCLLLIIAWRNGLSDRSDGTRRAMRWVIAVYSAVIVALWVLFALADAPVERLRDLDTYYATTPFMREEILLYLLAHTVATVITSRLIWNWVRTHGLDAWLRWGLKFLGLGYASQLVFDAAKLTAVTARWTGHDLDWLSTVVAPPVACLSAVLIAVGFILPHAGQYLHERRRLRLAHHELRPLYLLTRRVNGHGLPFLLRATPELRLTRRETFIRDTLLPLASHLDEDLRARSYDAALTLGFTPDRAKAVAAAVAILELVEAGTGPAGVAAPSGADGEDLANGADRADVGRRHSSGRVSGAAEVSAGARPREAVRAAGSLPPRGTRGPLREEGPAPRGRAAVVGSAADDPTTPPVNGSVDARPQEAVRVADRVPPRGTGVSLGDEGPAPRGRTAVVDETVDDRAAVGAASARERAGGRQPDGVSGSTAPRSGGMGDPDTTDLLREIGAVSRALRWTEVIDAVRARAADAAVAAVATPVAGPAAVAPEVR